MSWIRRNRFQVLLMTVLLVVIITITLISVNYAQASATNNVSMGASGQVVKDIQKTLKDWGYYNGQVDGKFGQGTYNAVVKFQKKNGLKADGVVGKSTFEAMGLNKYIKSQGQNQGQGNAGSAAVSNQDDVTLLAKAIFAESEGEPYIGKVAVGAVLLNRVADPSFPNTLSGVCYQSLALESVSNGRFQASPNNDDCTRAAQDAINGWDPTSGCLYFWNPKTSTSAWIWTRQIVVQYGNHVFGK